MDFPFDISNLADSAISMVAVKRLNTMENKVFVTVGSTSFDELISMVCSSKVLGILSSKGYDKITLQTGRGTYTPSGSSTIQLESYRYVDDISEDFKSSSLVISHAGAGSILQALELHKPLIVVINDKLMNNHQEELARELAKDGYLKYCYCENLAETIETLNTNKLLKYTPGDQSKFLFFIDQIMGYEK